MPASCTLCGSPLPQLSSVSICDFCWASITALTGTACTRCGDELHDVLDRGALNQPSGCGICRACRMAPPPLVIAVAFGPYQGRLRQAIDSFNYDRVHPAACGLGRMLASAIAQLSLRAPAAMLVVPIPLHRIKHTQRGLNRARALSQALRFLAISHPDWQLTLASSALMRLRATASQAMLTPRQRCMNLRGAFSVTDPAAVKDKHILLIDDILTTDVTARAASQALLRAGAASVWVATLSGGQRMAGFQIGFTELAECVENQSSFESVSSAGQLSSQGQRSCS